MKRGITGTATNAEYGAIYKTITGTRRSDLKVDALDCERGEMPDIVDPWEPPYEPWQIDLVGKAEAGAIASQRTPHDGLVVAAWTGEALSDAGATFGLSVERVRQVRKGVAVAMVDRIAAIPRRDGDRAVGIPVKPSPSEWHKCTKALWLWLDWHRCVLAAVDDYRFDRYGPPARRNRRGWIHRAD